MTSQNCTLFSYTLNTSFLELVISSIMMLLFNQLSNSKCEPGHKYLHFINNVQLFSNTFVFLIVTEDIYSIKDLYYSCYYCQSHLKNLCSAIPFKSFLNRRNSTHLLPLSRSLTQGTFPFTHTHTHTESGVPVQWLSE